jgi:DNA (cytosine-5)-methyltransferase 1
VETLFPFFCGLILSGEQVTKKLNGIVAVDLFCGVGGLAHGLRRAGVDVSLGIDIDGNCKYPFEHNNGARFLEKSVHDVSPGDLTPAWGDARYKLLAGCAPCQPFSTYSQASEPSSDERWPLLFEFGRLVAETRPDFVTMENVPKLERQEVYIKFVKILEALRYRLWSGVVNCADYGVPQLRRRLVLLASAHADIRLVPPSTKRKPRTVRQTIGSLAPLEAGEIASRDPMHQCSGLSAVNLARIKASVPGGSWKDWPENLRTRCHARATGRGYVSVYGRMSWDEPSPTMTTQFYGFGSGRFGHPDQDRGISLREGAMLQSFPKRYQFVEPGAPIEFKKIGRLIGNAVPVQLAEAIGRTIVSHAARLG